MITEFGSDLEEMFEDIAQTIEEHDGCNITLVMTVEDEDGKTERVTYVVGPQVEGMAGYMGGLCH